MAGDIFKRIFLNETSRILIRISLRIIHDGLIYYKSALVQVMAWRRTGAKPLPEPMIPKFIDACMRHQAPMS